MFPVETLPAQYCEEREAARKLAEEQRCAAEATQVKAPVATQQASPGSLAQALQPRPLSRPGSSSVLGSIFQTFKRVNSGPGSPAASISPSATPSRTQTPVLQTAMDKEKPLCDGAKRDSDQYPALPGWY
jgi:hypothetical protein